MNASGGGGAAFICYWLVVFVCFFLLWERLTLFLEGIGVLSCGYLWLSFYLRSHCSFTYDYFPPPSPPLSLPNVDAEIREHTLSSEGLLQKQLFVQVVRSRALSSVQILAK